MKFLILETPQGMLWFMTFCAFRIRKCIRKTGRSFRKKYGIEIIVEKKPGDKITLKRQTTQMNKGHLCDFSDICKVTVLHSRDDKDEVR